MSSSTRHRDALVERDVESASVAGTRAGPTRGRARGAGREPMQPPGRTRDEARAALADVDVERRRVRLASPPPSARRRTRCVACDRSRPSPPARRRRFDARPPPRDERRVLARARRASAQRPPARRARRRRRRPRRRRCSSRRRRRRRTAGGQSPPAAARAAERGVFCAVASRVAVALVPPPLAAENLDVERRRTVAEAPAAFGREPIQRLRQTRRARLRYAVVHERLPAPRADVRSESRDRLVGAARYDRELQRVAAAGARRRRRARGRVRAQPRLAAQATQVHDDGHREHERRQRLEHDLATAGGASRRGARRRPRHLREILCSGKSSLGQQRTLADPGPHTHQ